MNEWISVKDRLPEKDVGVLVYTRNRFVSTLDHEDIDYLEENGEFHRYNGNQYISHWMPLPQKPESEDDAEWVDNKCSVCGKGIENLIESREWYENEKPNYCPFCGTMFIMKGSDAE